MTPKNHTDERRAPSGTGSYVCAQFREFTSAQHSLTELRESAKLCRTDLGGSIRTLLLLGLLAAIQPGAADPRIGSWTLISAQSSLDPPNRLSITPLHDGVHVVMSGETHLDFTANGTDTNRPYQAIRRSIKLSCDRIDKRQAEVKEKKDGAVVATVRDKLSKDGNELTTTTATAGHADQDHRVDAKRRHEGRQ